MSIGRVDPRLVEHFSAAKASSSNTQNTHGVAASIHADASQELLKELPAVGPITYLPEIEVLLADVEVAGFQHLVEHQEVHALSDAELTFDVPAPLDAEQQMPSSQPGDCAWRRLAFSEQEGKGVTVVAVMDTPESMQNMTTLVGVVDQISCVEGATKSATSTATVLTLQVQSVVPRSGLPPKPPFLTLGCSDPMVERQHQAFFKL